MARLIDADAIMTEIANIRLSDPIADSTRNLILSILGLAPTVEANGKDQDKLKQTCLSNEGEHP